MIGCSALAVEPTLDSAQTLFNKGQYQLAALEFERVVFKSTDKPLTARALIGKAYCKKALGDYNQALVTLNRINIRSLPDTLIYSTHYEKALCLYLLENFEGAESELAQLKYLVSDSSLMDNAAFLNILILNEQGEWSYAKLLFEEYLVKNNFSLEYLSLYNFLDNEKTFKKVKKGKTLSYIFPGLGQMYAGHFWRGLASLALNGLTLTYAVYSIASGYYMAGIFTGVALFTTFYTGGARHAEFLINKRNTEYTVAINKKIRETIAALEKNRHQNNNK